MTTIGLDLHERESQLCIAHDDGAIQERRIVTSRDQFMAVVGALVPGPRESPTPIKGRPCHRNHPHDHSTAGGMFWLWWKTLSGSYAVFTATSRS
jgi:hypothetical protein